MTKERENDFKDIYINVEKIITQMEEKVYSLHGPTHSFDSMSINNLVGKFHPRKDYETGEIKYLVTIKVPEFSMKRGDVVLLSGESGVGKSTFLRLLKRGDYNNRDTIQLNTGEKVDNFGNEYISFRPSTKLGNEKSVLYEITGKDSISSLTKNERKNLLEILTKLSFPQKDLLEHLATKKFAEFSTGQQRRLALSKLFYRIEDGGSVIIVDEPVENVEEKLIKEQLQMIVNYAKQRNVMLIITTHRLDLAKDLATKRYNINKEGVLEQIPIKDKEQDR